MRFCMKKEVNIKIYWDLLDCKRNWANGLRVVIAPVFGQDTLHVTCLIALKG
jgi:hypothetical protein